MNMLITKKSRPISRKKSLPKQERGKNKMTLQAGVITISDKGFRGDREDQSGPAIIKILSDMDISVTHSTIIPDEIELIAEALREYADMRKLDLIITTGGTGVSPRDVTP